LNIHTWHIHFIKVGEVWRQLVHYVFYRAQLHRRLWL